MSAKDMGAVYNVCEADFDLLVTEASRRRPVLVDISADWCAPCRALAPTLQRAVVEAEGAVALALVDADENMRIAGRHKVRGFPTVVAYSGGSEVARFHGAKPLDFVRRFIDELRAKHDGAIASKA